MMGKFTLLSSMESATSNEETQITGSIRLIKHGAENISRFLATLDDYTPTTARRAAAEIVCKERAYLLDYFSKLLNVDFVPKAAKAEQHQRKE